jgi:hypothetical protein
MALAENGVELGFAQGGFKDFADEAFIFLEAIDVGGGRVFALGVHGSCFNFKNTYRFP